MGNFFADVLDNVGTTFNLPELGWSEGAAGNTTTSNTGRVPMANASGANEGAKDVVGNAYVDQHRQSIVDGINRDVAQSAAAQAAAGGAQSSAPNSGGASGGGVNYAAIAAAQAAQKREAARRNLIATQNGYRDSANQNVLDTANKYQNDTQKFLGTIEDGQTQINTGRTNNALNARRSMSNIAGGIRTGLKSGGVQLANMNATDSGAADAMARAYAEMGNQQVGDVNNEALLKENEFNGQQTVLNRNKEEGINSFDRERNANIERIKGDLRTKLALLDATGQAEGVDGAVDMSMIDAIVGEAINRLSAVDSQRGQRLGNAKTLSQDEINRQAAEMDALGQGGTSPFTAGTEGIGLVGQDSMAGANISQLPFYTRKQDDQQMALPVDDKDKQQTF